MIRKEIVTLWITTNVTSRNHVIVRILKIKYPISDIGRNREIS